MREMYERRQPHRGTNLFRTVVLILALILLLHLHRYALSTSQSEPEPETVSNGKQFYFGNNFDFLDAAQQRKVEKSANIHASLSFTNPPDIQLITTAKTFVPIIVFSKASNTGIRDAIRRTWAYEQIHRNGSLELKVFFLVGTDDSMTERIRAEQNLFSDTIQVSVSDLDSYLSYKELAAMLWIKTYIPESSFFMKTDDSIILNTNSFVQLLLPEIENIADEALVFGWFGSEHTIQREKYQKFVDALQPRASLPFDYAMNLFYAVTLPAVERMLHVSNEIQQIKEVGHTFVTGFLRHAAQIQLENLASLPKKFRYESSTGNCGTAFQQDPMMLFCTISSSIEPVQRISEYFNTWDVLISKS